MTETVEKSDNEKKFILVNTFTILLILRCTREFFCLESFRVLKQTHPVVYKTHHSLFTDLVINYELWVLIEYRIWTLLKRSECSEILPWMNFLTGLTAQHVCRWYKLLHVYGILVVKKILEQNSQYFLYNCIIKHLALQYTDDKYMQFLNHYILVHHAEGTSGIKVPFFIIWNHYKS